MDRPFVYLNMAMTVDGKITSSARERPRFTSEHDRRQMDRLRATADGIMIGARTVRADNPAWHVRSAAMREHRKSLGKPAGLLRVVVTAGAEIDRESRFFDDSHACAGRIVATVEDASGDRLAALQSMAEVWKIGRGRVDLPELLRRLAARRVERLLVEGGGELNWALVRDDLVDELHVTIAPALLGGQAAPTLLEGPGFTMKMMRRLRLEQLVREGDELFCRYVVER